MECVKVSYGRYRLVNKKQKRARARKISEGFTRREKANEIIAFAADNQIETVLQKFDASLEGLSEKGVIASRNAYGENKVTHEKKKTMPQRLAEAFINPFTAILFCLAIVSTITDIILPAVRGTPEDADPLTVIIIMTMVVISGALRFVQESRSGNAAEKLLGMITTTCTVDREEEKKQEIPLVEAVVGDIIHLSAGDMIPADVRIIEAKDLFISQSALTGESEPVEKFAAVGKDEVNATTEYSNIAFMGSNVISADDCNDLFGQRCRIYVQEKDNRKEFKLHPEFWSD